MLSAADSVASPVARGETEGSGVGEARNEGGGDTDAAPLAEGAEVSAAEADEHVVGDLLSSALAEGSAERDCAAVAVPQPVDEEARVAVTRLLGERRGEVEARALAVESADAVGGLLGVEAAEGEALVLAALLLLAVALTCMLRVAPVPDAKAVWETVGIRVTVVAGLGVCTALALTVLDTVTALVATLLALGGGVVDGEGLSLADRVELGDCVSAALARADADAEAERVAERVLRALTEARSPLAVGMPLVRALAETEPHELGRKLGAPLAEAARVGAAVAVAIDDTEVTADAPALALLRADSAPLTLGSVDSEAPAVDDAVPLCSSLAVVAALSVRTAVGDGVTGAVSVPL